MKILLLNTFDNNGGAAVASKRLVEALLQHGHEVELYSLIKSSQEKYVNGISSKVFSKISVVAEKLHFQLHQKNKDTRFLFSSNIFPFNKLKKIPFQNFDIIHLHWTNQGLLSYHDLTQLVQSDIPIVWTLHDMWAMTGGCHYNGNCQAYIQGCNHCPLLKSPSQNDLSFRISNRKKALYRQGDINFVACSSWLKSTALKSHLLKDSNVTNIPNPIDTTLFKPASKPQKTDKISFMFQASDINDKRKGFSILLKALGILTLEQSQFLNNIEFTIIGKGQQDQISSFSFPIRETGFISDKTRLINEYNKVDYYVTPSLQDNLPNSVMESLACGVPVIAFNTGGIPEMVKHKETGYIAKFKTPASLAQQIRLAINNHDKYDILSKNARDHVLANYSSQIIAKRYTDLYKSIKQS